MRTHHLMTAVACLALVAAGSEGAIAQTRTTLDIYMVDVEGGNATLFVAPSGQSLLIDTGNFAPGGFGARCRAHHGGRQGRRPHPDRPSHHHPLARRSFRRHGGTRQAHPDPRISSTMARTFSPRPRSTTSSRDVYPKLYANAKHTVAKAGDKIAVAGLDVTVVTSAGETLKTALPGAGAPNPYCASFKPGDNNAEDPMSVGSLHHVRKVPHHASRRPHQEQGIRADVPEQPIGARRRCSLASHHGRQHLEFGSASCTPCIRAWSS